MAYHFKSIHSLILFFLISISIGFNYQLGGSATPIYICHMVWFAYILVTLFMLIFNMISLIRSYEPSNLFISESFKYLFSITTSLFLIIGIRSKSIKLNYIATAIPIGVFISTITLLQSNPFDLTAIDLASRLDIEALGGFNTYAFLVSNGIICLLYILNVAKKNIFINIIILLLIAYLFIILLSTLSRNGMFGLIFAIMVYGYYQMGRAKTFAAIGLFIFLITPVLFYLLNTDYGLLASRFIFDDDFYSGSGRTDIWTGLLHIMASEPLSIIFGFGVGEIDLQIPGSWSAAYSAHNHFLQFFYEFGIIFLVGVIYFFYRLFNRLKRIEDLNKRSFLLAINSQILFNMLFDSTLQTSQAGWFFAFWLTFLYIQSDPGIKSRLN